MQRCVLAGLLMVSAAVGAVRSYTVDPVQASWSGRTRRAQTVSQVITVNFDLPVKAALFVGDSGAGGGYDVEIQTHPEGAVLATGNVVNPGSYCWAVCTLDVSRPDSFIKGRQVQVVWTRAGQDSIEYLFDRTDPYQNPYGWMELGGDQPPPRPTA